MTKYRVGDQVMIRPDLEVGKSYPMEDGSDYWAVTMEMASWGGEIVTISEASEKYYSIKEHSFFWSDTMFEPLDDAELEESDVAIEDLLFGVL